MSLRLPSPDDIVLGSTCSPLPYPQFRLSPQDQSYHATCWGRTGSGKSKLLESIFLQHVNKKHAVGLIEPHADLSSDCITYLISHGFFQNEDAYDRLIYVDFGNGAYYIPFNILAEDGRTDPHTRALNALEAMTRVWPELVDAPLFQQLFLSGLMALIANQLPITYLYQLLSDADFRSRCLRRVDDPLVNQTFDSFEKLGREQVQAAGSTLRRAFLLTFSPLARLTLGQPDNYLDFRRLMDAGKSIIMNLGNVNDHQTRALLGAMLMVQIEQAALSRTDIPPSQRVPFTLLVDEWPDYAAQGATIGTILSQTRKFNLRIYLSGQSLSQVSSDRLSGALENCRCTIVFGLGRNSAEISAKNVGQADPFLVKEPPLTLAQHATYQTIVEQFESWTQELQNLPSRQAYVKLHDQPAVRIKTLTVPDVKVDPDDLREVLDTYKRRYQRTREEAEQAVANLPILQPAPQPQAKPPAYTTLFRRPGSGER